jgi:hypothetical protein
MTDAPTARYLPTSRDRQEGTLWRKRGEYQRLVAQYFEVAGASRDESELAILHQVRQAPSWPRSWANVSQLDVFLRNPEHQTKQLCNAG